MAEAESFVELSLTKDKFESSKPNGKGNGERNREKDEERHNNDGNNTDSTSGNRKPRDVKRGSNNPMDKGKRIKCFLCQGPHMTRKYPKKSMILAIEKKDVPEKSKPVKKKTSKVNSMKRSALVNTRESNFFISEKAAEKLVLSFRKSNKKIKTVIYEEAPNVGVVRNVELQINDWKGKKDFEVIQLDDYDYLLGLNFLDMI
ncbi:hypothetical protein Golax_001927 [Gossypium laxum]|uniref:Uncharacterized protein n=1 Tax=Gossypium laxum TaxID=34288 RepID=A0A7J9APP0_9ROSI|nr:hypothetical protein [Gossypium laxum]